MRDIANSFFFFLTLQTKISNVRSIKQLFLHWISLEFSLSHGQILTKKRIKFKFFREIGNNVG